MTDADGAVRSDSRTVDDRQRDDEAAPQIDVGVLIAYSRVRTPNRCSRSPSG